jgi:hypothetical protein
MLGMIMSRTIVVGSKTLYASMNARPSVVTRTPAEVSRDVLDEAAEGGRVVADQQSFIAHPNRALNPHRPATPALPHCPLPDRALQADDVPDTAAGGAARSADNDGLDAGCQAQDRAG